MAERANDVRIARLIGIGQKRETDAERIKRHGWNPLTECSYCGDTGINPDLRTECFCIVGTRLIERSARELHWLNIVPKRFTGYTLTDHPNTKLADEVGAWIDSNPCRTGENLVISGKTGVGKTGAAIGAIRELHFQGATVVYWFLPDLMDQLRADEFGRRGDDDALRKKPTMHYLTDCDCLLLDDMGTERHTDYVKDRMHLIFDARYTHNRPTILTTNYEGAKWQEYLGPRIFSRISENVRYLVATGVDLRRSK